MIANVHNPIFDADILNHYGLVVDRLFKFLKMPFSLGNATQTLQRFIEQIL